MQADRRVVGNRQIGRNPFSWAQYDALPPIVRRVMQSAPIDLGTERATKALSWPGARAEECARYEWGYAWSCARERCLHDYGPTHPNAARPRDGR